MPLKAITTGADGTQSHDGSREGRQEVAARFDVRDSRRLHQVGGRHDGYDGRHVRSQADEAKKKMDEAL